MRMCRGWRMWAIGASVIVVAWIGLGIVPWLVADSHEDAARFGGSFTFVEALFSALAFGGVIVSLTMQRDELRLQRQELQETRAELRRTADAQESQQSLMLEHARIMREAARISAVGTRISMKSLALQGTQAELSAVDAHVRELEASLAGPLSVNVYNKAHVELPLVRQRQEELRVAMTKSEADLAELESRLRLSGDESSSPAP